MGFNGTRSVGTVLMGIGLALILGVGGYFAWSEVQSAQMRSELEQSAAAASERATRIASQAATARSDTDGRVSGGSAQVAGAARVALTETRAPILPVPTYTPLASATAAAPATQSATRVHTPTGLPASPTARPPTATPEPPTPTPAPTRTPAPVMPVRLAIPDLKIDTKVVEMGWEVVQTAHGPQSQWVIPKNEAGHHINSAGIGQADNLVISGHNNIFGRVFMPISQAWNNDGLVKIDNFTDKSPALDGREIELFDAAGTKYTYVVTDFYRLRDTGVSQAQREANASFIQPSGDERLTIITCWPPTNNTHRLVVIARPDR